MIKESYSDRVLKVCFYVIMALFAIYCLVPFLTVISNSLTTEDSIVKNGFSIFPREFSLEAFKLIFKDSTIYRAYGVTIFVTVVGTFLAMLVTCALAYPLAVRALKYKNWINFYVYFTLLFNGGLVSSYLLISKYLDMRDSIWVLIIPALVSPWNMFLFETFSSRLTNRWRNPPKWMVPTTSTFFSKSCFPYRCLLLRQSVSSMDSASGISGLKRCCI